jgi:hypothetical protein
LVRFFYSRKIDAGQFGTFSTASVKGGGCLHRRDFGGYSIRRINEAEHQGALAD